jgi:RNA polymerase sigma-70 factor (ECF subfamily)
MQQAPRAEGKGEAGMRRESGVIDDGRADGAPADEWLMRAIAEGDRAAFAQLAERHLDRVVRIAARVGLGQAEAEDVGQDVMTKLWVEPWRWNPGSAQRTPARFSTWLYRVTVNAAIDVARRRRFAALDEAPEREAEDLSGFETIANRQIQNDVQAAIAALPERQRLALGLCFFEEMTNAEAADILGLSVKALEALLVRARRGLRESLAPHYRELKESGS